MKTKIMLVAALLCGALGACKKKANDTPAPKEQIKLLSKITSVFTATGQTTVVAITYDSKNRMIKKGDLNYIYDGDDMVAITSGTSTTPLVSYTYINGVPQTSDTKGPGFDLNFKYKVSNGLVVSAEPTTGFAVGTHVFTYLNHNLVDARIKDDAGYSSEFGLDKNPYYNPTCKYVLDLTGQEPDDHFSKNNMTEHYYQQFPFLGSYTSSTIGPDGYPTSAVIKTTKQGDPDSFNYTNVTYEYVMRDVAQ